MSFFFSADCRILLYAHANWVCNRSAICQMSLTKTVVWYHYINCAQFLNTFYIKQKKLNASNINICKITCNLNIYLNVIISMITFGPNLYCCDIVIKYCVNEKKICDILSLKINHCQLKLTCKHIWTEARQNRQNDLCAQRTLWSACACEQSDQNLCCPLEETLAPWLPIDWSDWAVAHTEQIRRVFGDN